MTTGTLRVELFHDLEANNWNFIVPALNITGGGCKTREEARRHALEAINFALADNTRDDRTDEVEVLTAQIKVTLPGNSEDRSLATG